MGTTTRETRSTTPARRVSVLLALTLVSVVSGPIVGLLRSGTQENVAAAAGDVGYAGPSFVNNAGSPSGEKPESKLWWNDGVWWASLWSDTALEHHIHRLDLQAKQWIDTGVTLDPRRGSKADVLWDGSKLYVASHSFSESEKSGYPSRLYRFSYDQGARTYTLDAGFPTTINDWRTETLVIDKDSSGQLWATWTQPDGGCNCSRVYVNRTIGNDSTWGTPFIVPITGVPVGAGELAGDDISALVAFAGGRIGVMWSNQNEGAMYFATHDDSSPDATWNTTRTAIQGANEADDHINLKSLQSDGSGRVFAAVKTSLSGADDTLTRLLVRDSATGAWANYTFGRVSDHHTRPIVMVDTSAGKIHMLATADENGGTIYRKTTSLSSINFPVGRGEPFIEEAATPGTSGDLNNATSTKQNVNSTTGLVVLATNDTTDRYWWNYDPLNGQPPGNDTTPPSVAGRSPSDGSTAVEHAANVTATFTEPVVGVSATSMILRTQAGAAVAATVGYDAATTTATLDPTTDLVPSTTYVVTLTSAITDTASPANPLAGAPVTWSFTTAGTAPPPTGAISMAGPPVTATASAASIDLPSWSPSDGDLLVIEVARRKTGPLPTVTGNGLSWTMVADAKNTQNQGAVSVFTARAGPATTAGSVQVSITGNSSPVSVVAQRFSGVAGVGAVKVNQGPSVDNADMLESIVAGNGTWVLGAGWHRSKTFTVPAGETAVATNVTSGSGGDITRASMWFEGPVTAGTVALGAAGDLSGVNDWALVLLELQPSGTGTTTTTTVPTSTTTTTTVPTSTTTTTTVPTTTTTVPTSTTTTTTTTTPPTAAAIRAVGGPVTVTGSGTSASVPMTAGPNETILVQVALRDTKQAVTISGLSLPWQSESVVNTQGQGSVRLYWAKAGASGASGTIQVSIAGNTKPLSIIAQRFEGVAGIGSVTSHAGPAVDDRDMLATITNVDAGAWVVAAGWHRTKPFTVPGGETVIAPNVTSGSGGDQIRASMWYESSPAGASTLQLGAPSDLSGVNDWALILVELTRSN